MQTVFYEGVAIQLCMTCKGIFLSKKKLGIIEDSREIEIPKDTPIPRNGVEVLRHCPKCEDVMKKVPYGNIRSTTIDYCGMCTGIWLDKGELASIQFSYEIAEDNRLRNQRLRS
jgi:Zn-finger nucleic acid-binding protein